MHTQDEDDEDELLQDEDDNLLRDGEVMRVRMFMPSDPIAGARATAPCVLGRADGRRAPRCE